MEEPFVPRRPSIGAVIAGLVPFAGMCFSVAFWDRVDPIVLGVPFNLAWLMSWMVLTPLCLAVAYRLEGRRPAARGDGKGGSGGQ